jgi:hypothetical protein
LATEFPIKGQCTILEIKSEVAIPSTPEPIPTQLEVAGVQRRLNLEQNLAEIDSDMHGLTRESFLLDNLNLPCLANQEARWVGISNGNRKEWSLQFLSNPPQKVESRYRHNYVPVCVDGILVAGEPGRPSFMKDIGARLGSRNSNIYSDSPALIDARGDIKPEITPGRTVPEGIFIDMPPGWQCLNQKLQDFQIKGLVK